MSRLALVSLLLSAGCLYLGDLNHAPQIDAVTVQTHDTNKGTPIFFAVSAHDLEDPPAALSVGATVSSGDGQPVSEHCDYLISNVDAFGFALTFYRTGVFEITTKVTDSERAKSIATTMVTITNAPPVFDTSTMLAPRVPPRSCGAFTAGGAIAVELSAPPVDSDQNAVSGYGDCPGPEVLTYDWSVTTPPGSHPLITPYTDGSGCTPATSASGPTFSSMSSSDICVWPDYGTLPVTTTYTLTVSVTDGMSETPATLTLPLAVAADSPPCVTGTEPEAGSYVVDPQNPAPFDTLIVSGVTDDLDTYPTGFTYSWSLWRESDPTWRAIPNGDYKYSPDYSIFGVGEHVRIRAEAIDRTGARATCDVSQDDCTVYSCSAMTCDKWKTWDLELR